ncbi:MAG: cytochrome P460 family protein [Acidobacteriota bacterium]
MIKRKLSVLLMIGAAILVTSLVVISSAKPGAGPLVPGAAVRARRSTTDDDDQAVIRKLAKYRGWALVNPVPVLMDPMAAAACAVVLSNPLSPHASKYISVYVNGNGQDAMMKQRESSFPAGSIIVKEKLSYSAAKSPELLTVMIKRDPGYDSASGDWEYLVMDGTATKINERGRIKSCNSCHVAYRPNDFVTRTYLPIEVRKELK